MWNIRIRELISILISALVVLGLLFLAGCAGKEHGKEAGARLDPSAQDGLPKYRQGTVFVYSNGSWDRVESVSGKTVNWIDHRGNRSSGFADFTFRPVDWESTNYIGVREFKRAEFGFSDVPYSLWPLSVGKKSGFIEENRWRPRDGYEREYSAYWSCRVEGQEQITVPAGTFDSWKVFCGRYSGSMRKNTAFAREYRTWYYSPDISHWVAMERERFGVDETVRRRIELAAVLPSLADLPIGSSGRKSIRTFYQDVLETKGAGEQSVWKTDNGSVALTMVPIQTFRRKSTMVCRQYRQELHLGGDRNAYYGVACRNSDGDWSVPRRGR